MHNVAVNLTNAEGLRLTVNVPVAVRNTPYENWARDRAIEIASADEYHAKHGPWSAGSSHFTS